MKTVLVTGAAGLIGQAVCKHLAGRYKLRSLDVRPVEGLESTVADIADLASIRPAFVAADAVVHLAASASPDSPWAATTASGAT